MRVSTGMIYDSGLASMQSRTSALLRSQQQISSGRRILAPSDDPVAAARALEVTQSLQANKAQAVTRNDAKNALGIADGYLQSATELLGRVRELTVQAGDAALSASDRKSIALELRQRFDELLAIANAKDGIGNSLFAGFQVGNSPFAGSVEDGVKYSGDDGLRALQVSNSRQLGINLPGNDIFMRLMSGNGVFATATQNDKSINAKHITYEGTSLIANPPATTGSFDLRFWTDATASTTYYDLVDSSGNSLYTGAPSQTGGAGNTYTHAYTSGSSLALASAGPQAFNYGASVVFTGIPSNGDSFSVSRTTSGISVTERSIVSNAARATIDAGAVIDPLKWSQSTNSGNLELRFWVDTQGTVQTPGQAVGSIAPTLPLIVASGVGDRFDIQVDGGVVRTAAIPAGTYSTLAQVSNAIQGAMDNAVPAAPGTATVTLDSNGRIVITSDAPGAASAINLTEGNGALARVLGAPAITAGSGATAGGALGNPSATPVLPVTIDAGFNDQFYVDIDGAGAQLITLTPGTYSLASSVQTEIQTQLAALGAPYNAATVGVNGNGYLTITSGSPVGSVALSPGVSGAAVAATDITYGTWVPAVSGASGVIASDTGISGVFNPVTLFDGTMGATMVDGLDAQLDFAKVTPGTNVQAITHDFGSPLDLSGVGANITFSISDGDGVNSANIDLNGIYNTLQDVATAINTQLGGSNVDVAVTVGGGKLIFTNNDVGLADGSLDTLVNGSLIGLAADPLTLTQGTGVSDAANPTHIFLTPITLSGDSFNLSDGISTETINPIDGAYSDGNALATAINNALALSTNFTNVTAAFSGGQLTFTNVGSANVLTTSATSPNLLAAGMADTSGTAGVYAAGLNVQTINAISNLDLSTPGALAQFDVTDGTNSVGITLAGTYMDGNALAADIEAQVRQGAGNLASTTVAFVNGNLVFTNAGNLAAISIQYPDTNAINTLGITSATGLAGGSDEAAAFTVDGNPVTLNASYVDNDAVAAAIQTQLGGSYTVAWNPGTTQYDIANNTVGSTAPVIVATNAAAYNQGWDTAANLTLSNGTAAESYTFSLGVEGGGTIPLFNQTGGVVNAADIDLAVTANAAALAAAGISTVGTAVGGDLQFTNANGYDVTLTAVNQAGIDGFANMPFNTGGAGYTTDGLNGTTNGFVTADSGTAFSIDINGINLYTEAGSVGGTITAAELDAALTSFLASNPDYTQVSGSFAGGDLRLTNAAGTGITFNITQFTGGANPVTNGVLSVTTVNNPGTTGIGRNALPLVFGSAPVVSGNSVTGSPLATPLVPLTVEALVNDQFTIDVDNSGPQTITMTPGNYYTADDIRVEVQQQLDTLGIGASVSIGPSGGLVVMSNSTGATSSAILGPSPASGRDGLGQLFGQPTALQGVDAAAGRTYYDIVDASTGNSLFTGAASTAGGPGNSYTHAYNSPATSIALANSGGAGQMAFDFGASITVSGIPAGGDAFTIRSSADYTGNGYFVTEAKKQSSYNTGSGIIGTGDIIDEAKWNHPANSRNLEVRFWQDPNDIHKPKTSYYDLVDVETEKSLFTNAASTAGGASNSYTHVFKPGDAVSFSGLSVPYGLDTITDFGISVTINGEPASGDAFKIEASQSQSIFDTMAKTVQALESAKPLGTSGNVQLANELGAILTGLGRAEDSILSARAVFGTGLQEVDSLDSVGESMNLLFEDTLSRLQDLDYADAITKLTRQQMELQAAQQSFAKVSQLSLFDYIR